MTLTQFVLLSAEEKKKIIKVVVKSANKMQKDIIEQYDKMIAASK